MHNRSEAKVRAIKWAVIFVFALLPGVLVFPSCNPFAPGLDNTMIDRNALLGNRNSVDGLFRYFRNTYELRDSALYGKMLSPDFKFVYFDFTNNNQIFWGRDQEMQLTNKLFRGVTQVSLIWNNYVYADTTSDTLASVERYFNLTIVQDESNVLRGTGSARLTLRRANATQEWRIKEWFDKSDF